MAAKRFRPSTPSRGKDFHYLIAQNHVPKKEIAKRNASRTVQVMWQGRERAGLRGFYN